MKKLMEKNQIVNGLSQFCLGEIIEAMENLSGGGSCCEDHQQEAINFALRKLSIVLGSIKNICDLTEK